MTSAIGLTKPAKTSRKRLIKTLKTGSIKLTNYSHIRINWGRGWGEGIKRLGEANIFSKNTQNKTKEALKRRFRAYS